ncbi:MAG: tripartite tricarboxylate transporter TctB family protein [Qingshengfaniella sp.]
MRNRLSAALTSKSGLGALLLFAAATVTLTEVSNLRMGTPSAMGPGYFPAILGGLFILFGMVLLVEAWQNPDDRIAIGPIAPVACLLGAIVVFGLIYPLLGGALAMSALVILSALAEKGRSLTEVLLLAVVVVGLIWLIFVQALDLQLTMLPPWMTP